MDKDRIETAETAKSRWPGMTIVEEISSGSYGTVYRVSLDGREYAMKQIRVPADTEEEEALVGQLGSREAVKEYSRNAAKELLEEVRVMQDFRDDPHIVTALDYQLAETENGCEIDLLMEYLEPFPVYETTHLIDEKAAIRLGTDLCCALESCEKKAVLHRDLKPENILVT